MRFRRLNLIVASFVIALVWTWFGFARADESSSSGAAPASLEDSDSQSEQASSEEDLSSLVWTLRGEHQPMTDERFAPVRKELRKRAQALERVIDRSNTAARWRKYLRWELLEPHFHDDVKINRQSLQDLEAVLRRFRGNQPGLEMAAFRRTAAAIERYRELVFWNALAKRRDTTAIYDSYIKRLQEQMRRHLEDPTIETTRKVGKSLGMLEHQGQASELLSAIRSRYSQPNIRAEISLETLNEVAEPITRQQPVRECILGASVRGTAQTTGNVTFASVESPGEIELNIHLAGYIDSNTVGYKKPVKIYSTGHTDYTASKQVYISDRRFHASPAHVSAKANNQTRSVRKVGGKFGRKLIEKIAWKKVRKNKGKVQRISSGKARRRISEAFDDQVFTALADGRTRYEDKLRLPMLRRGFAPEEIHFASTSQAFSTQFSLATGEQIATDTPPPAKDLQNDVTVQLHETAINNFLPFVLGGVSISQDSADQPQQMEGDVPSWLRKLAENGEVEASTPAESSEGQVEEPFKPYRLTFNSEHPASVRFHNGKLTIRLRFAVLKTSEFEDEPPLENWDFMVTYQVQQRDNEVVLSRDGDIEVFPTGFDPRWDTKMTNEQVGYRNNMAKNLNKRAALGEGFPAEIVVPELKLDQLDDSQRSFALQQLECDDGWLTIGYRVF